KALAKALLAFVHRTSSDEVLGLVSFLAEYPRSAWKASLLLNLGQVYRRTGYFSKALTAWEEAWNLAGPASGPNANVIGDNAVGELLELYARLGRFDRLESVLQQISGRDIRGPATVKLTAAREGLYQMRNRPEKAFRCGPLALDRIRAS